MYCINCGVELAAHETKCPLCATPVCNPAFLNPDAPRPYPSADEVHDEINRSGVIFLLSFLFLLPAVLTLVCDLTLNRTLVWAGYPVGALLLGYLIVVVPLWFRKPLVSALVFADFVGLAAFLFYINFAVGGSWFLTFALPITAMVAIIVCSVITLLRYYARYALAIFGGTFVMLGAALVATEYFINMTFYRTYPLEWSFYPLVICVLLGAALLVVAFSPKLKESLKKKFFM